MPTHCSRPPRTMAIALCTALFASVAFAQSRPAAPFQAQQPIQGQVVGQPFGGQPTVPANLPAQAAQALQLGHVYVSQRWLASFYFEEKLQIPGSPVFSAGRIVAIQPGSPLQQIGLNVGDVITRLDGTRVSEGKWPNQQGCFWMLPEFERHFGLTKVRFIRRGSIQVEEPTVNLGPRCRPQPIPTNLLP